MRDEIDEMLQTLTQWEMEDEKSELLQLLQTRRARSLKLSDESSIPQSTTYDHDPPLFKAQKQIIIHGFDQEDFYFLSSKARLTAEAVEEFVRILVPKEEAEVGALEEGKTEDDVAAAMPPMSKLALPEGLTLSEGHVLADYVGSHVVVGIKWEGAKKCISIRSDRQLVEELQKQGGACEFVLFDETRRAALGSSRSVGGVIFKGDGEDVEVSKWIVSSVSIAGKEHKVTKSSTLESFHGIFEHNPKAEARITLMNPEAQRLIIELARWNVLVNAMKRINPDKFAALVLDKLDTVQTEQQFHSLFFHEGNFKHHAHFPALKTCFDQTPVNDRQVLVHMVKGFARVAEGRVDDGDGGDAVEDDNLPEVGKLWIHDTTGKVIDVFVDKLGDILKVGAATWLAAESGFATACAATGGPVAVGVLVVVIAWKVCRAVYSEESDELKAVKKLTDVVKEGFEKISDQIDAMGSEIISELKDAIRSTGMMLHKDFTMLNGQIHEIAAGLEDGIRVLDAKVTRLIRAVLTISEQTVALQLWTQTKHEAEELRSIQTHLLRMFGKFDRGTLLLKDFVAMLDNSQLKVDHFVKSRLVQGLRRVLPDAEAASEQILYLNFVRTWYEISSVMLRLKLRAKKNTAYWDPKGIFEHLKTTIVHYTKIMKRLMSDHNAPATVGAVCLQILTYIQAECDFLEDLRRDLKITAASTWDEMRANKVVIHSMGDKHVIDLENYYVWHKDADEVVDPDKLSFKQVIILLSMQYDVFAQNVIRDFFKQCPEAPSWHEDLRSDSAWRTPSILWHAVRLVAPHVLQHARSLSQKTPERVTLERMLSIESGLDWSWLGTPSVPELEITPEDFNIATGLDFSLIPQTTEFVPLELLLNFDEELTKLNAEEELYVDPVRELLRQLINSTDRQEPTAADKTRVGESLYMCAHFGHPTLFFEITSMCEHWPKIARSVVNYSKVYSADDLFSVLPKVHFTALRHCAEPGVVTTVLMAAVGHNPKKLAYVKQHDVVEVQGGDYAEVGADEKIHLSSATFGSIVRINPVGQDLRYRVRLSDSETTLIDLDRTNFKLVAFQDKDDDFFRRTKLKMVEKLVSFPDIIHSVYASNHNGFTALQIAQADVLNPQRVRDDILRALTSVGLAAIEPPRDQQSRSVLSSDHLFRVKEPATIRQEF